MTFIFVDEYRTSPIICTDEIQSTTLVFIESFN